MYGFEQVVRWARPRLGTLEHEEVWLLSLDGKYGLKSARRIAQGGLHGCALLTRDVLSPALRDGASLAEIDPLQVIREAFQLIYAMNLQLPTRYLLLDRAVATVGSVGIELYPDFNVFEVAKPYARGLMMERFTPQRIAREVRRDAIRYAQVFAEAPFQWHDVLEELRDGQIEVGFVHKGLDNFLDQMQQVFNRLVIALVVTGGLIGSSLIGIFAKQGPHILGVNAVSVIGFALSTALGLWLLWGVIRSGRL